ncbi:hypothetical protein HDU97_009970 [Phlyctochytrium planicorne]|nr:hypothetical protein HDU97_009970 [Phlyctochytrium planicorne]
MAGVGGELKRMDIKGLERSPLNTITTTHPTLKLNNKHNSSPQLKTQNKPKQMPASTPVAIPSFAPIAAKPNAAARNPAKKVPPPANLPSGRSFI